MSPGPGASTGRNRGFTMLELLVTMAVIATVMSILAVTLIKVRGSARSFVCKNKLRTVAFDFIQFADDYAHPYRGESDRPGSSGFFIEDFQDRLYKVDEFWPKRSSMDRVEYKPSEELLMCPSVPGKLYRISGLNCIDGAVAPAENVSIGFNRRLYLGPMRIGNFSVARVVRLNKRILQHPSVPLAFDVDGTKAAQLPGGQLLPYYSAPVLDATTAPHNNPAFWFPASRHVNETNAAFIGGHVLTSKMPEKAPGWDWKYQPPVN